MNGIIYCATNRINGKKYIGQTIVSLAARKYAHEMSALKGSKIVFHCALRKHGIENFDWCVIFEGITDRDTLDVYEKAAIKRHDGCVPKGYNLTEGGRDWKRSEKFNLSMIRKMSREEVAARRSAGLRISHSRPETRQKLSENARRWRARPGVKEHISRVMKEVQNRPDIAEKRLKAILAAVNTPEAKAKKTQSMLRSWADPKVRENRAAADTEEVRNKKGAPHRGKPKSEAQKKKMSEASKGRNKGRTWEEIHGFEKAQLIKAKSKERARLRKVARIEAEINARYPD